MNDKREQIVAETFLETRAKILEIAATLDRIDHAADDRHEPAPGTTDSIREAIKILLEQSPDRAARVQTLFSRAYQSDWRAQFGIQTVKEGFQKD